MDDMNPQPQPAQSPVSTRQFLGRRAETDEGIARLSAESQSALRQFSADRLLGYGLAPADVVELRAAVIDGAAWQPAAEHLAEVALTQARAASGLAAAPSQVAYLRRASALLRMSQVMMDTDTPQRRATFVRAAGLYKEAALLATDREPVLIETEAGSLAGWLHPARHGAMGSAIVIGGVEGWAMDFESQGEALAARGIDALLLDGPGQGESRFAHNHYLDARWIAAYRSAIDFLAQRSPKLPIAFVGNSLGGTFAMAMAAADPRISACCSNCGVIRTAPPKTRTPNFAKMLAFCGTTDEDKAAAVWATMDPLKPVHGQDFPLLIVHGAKDPAVPLATAEMMLERAPTSDKQMVVFSDGDHCVYNHRDERDALIADWVRSQLAP